MTNPVSKVGAASAGDDGQRLVWLTAAVNLLLSAVVIYFLWQDHRDIERAAARQSENLVHLISQDFESDYRSVDLALTGVADELASEHAPSGHLLDDWLNSVRTHYPALSILRVTNAQGDVIYGPEYAAGTKANVADRDYFIRLRDDPRAGLQITDPLAGRTTGKIVIVLARRLTDARGQFIGVVIGSIPLDRFAAKLARLNIGTSDVIAIRNSDFKWILRYPASPQVGANSTFKTPAFEAALKVNPDKGGFNTQAGSIDGVDRLVSFERNAAYGFYVNVGLSRPEVFANWQKQVVFFAVFMVFFIALSNWLALRLRRAWRGQAKATESLRGYIVLFDAASRAARFGGWSVDLPSNRLTWTEETYRIHELEPGTVISVEMAIGFYAPESRPLITAAVQSCIEHGTPWDLDLQLITASGRCIWVRAVGQAERVDGRTTRLLGAFMDVSERKAHETQMSRSRERAEALLSLSALSGTLPELDYLRSGLQAAETLTGSEIGFLHFVNEDQESIELVTWTEGALRGCRAAYDAHYPISRAGIWADCFRQRGPVVFNDYAAYAAKKGLPDGHAHLGRLISVPVIEEGRVRMMMGVGNKATEYDDYDLQTVQLIGNDLWRIVRRQRAETALNAHLAELTELNQKLAQAQNQLLQSEKMATIGQLAAGVAHELNNPIGFIQSNMGTLAGYVDDLLELLEHCERCAEHCPDSARYDAFMRIRIEKDLDFLRGDIKQLLAESKDGTDRVRRIVQNLKDFSHVSEDEWVWTDLHDGLDSTLNLVANEIKYKAEVDRQYGTPPQVFCLAAQINQVFMNLLVNAAQAIETTGKITVATGFNEGATAETSAVWVEIRDTGKGISPENLQRIFDPFFTTKPVGQGTGLGLSLAWSIVQKHHGTLDVRSKVGEGTVFRLVLPVRGQPTRKDPTP